jgi:hypothetical protein
MSTDRIFQGEDQQWYFNVRGNQAVGPFISFSEANDAMTRHVSECKRRTRAGISWPEQLTPGRMLRRQKAVLRHT